MTIARVIYVRACPFWQLLWSRGFPFIVGALLKAQLHMVMRGELSLVCSNNTTCE